MPFSKHKEENIGFFVIDFSAGGGVERVTGNLMHRFRDEGFQNLYLISLKCENENPAMNFPAGISLKIVDKNHESRKEFASKLTTYLVENKITHLIFQGDNMTVNLQVLKAAKSANCKAYPQYHGSPHAYLRKYAEAGKPNTGKIIFAKMVYPFKKNKLKRFIKNSDEGVFCVSEGSASELTEIFKRDDKIIKKIKVIRNPIIISKNVNLGKEKIITFVSRLENKHKNAFLAVKAWALIANRFPDWKLIILGNGSLREEMEAFCSQNGITNIEFPGFVSNVDEILAKSSISLNVSNCEGFPMGVAEAIVQKNVLIATNSDGGAKDMLTHHSTALISPKNDVHAFALNIEKAILDKDLRMNLSENAYRNLVKIAEDDSFEMWMNTLFRN